MQRTAPVAIRACAARQPIKAAWAGTPPRRPSRTGSKKSGPVGRCCWMGRQMFCHPANQLLAQAARRRRLATATPNRAKPARAIEPGSGTPAVVPLTVKVPVQLFVPLLTLVQLTLFMPDNW